GSCVRGLPRRVFFFFIARRFSARLTGPSARFTVNPLGRKLPARFCVHPGGTMRGLPSMWILAALIACGAPMLAPAPAAAQGSYSPYAESPAAALARYVRT